MDVSSGEERNKSATVPSFISFEGSAGEAAGGIRALAAVRSFGQLFVNQVGLAMATQAGTKG